ncbi:bifunctional metallophosphatase/5'-nucleotidase [bacterium]|nr:bifunctional metallophosphatase/5'-nucleotidase [bacterium]
MTRIYAITDSHQESRNLSQLLSGIYNAEKHNNTPFLILDAGDLFKGIYDKNLSVNAYIKIKKLLPQAQIYLTLGNNDFGFKKSDFEYLKETVTTFKNAGIHMVCANIIDSNTKTKPDWITEYEIIELNGEKILIIGFCLNNSCAKKFGYDLIPAEESYDKLIKNIKEKYDKIIVLNHHWYTYSKALKEFAPEIDLIIGGHEHSPITPDYENNIFYPLSFARTLFQMDFAEKISNIEQIPVTDFPLTPEFEVPIVEYEQKIGLKKPIAKRVLNLTKKYSDACPLGTFISDAMRKAGNTDIAFHSTGFTMYPMRLEDSEFITKYDIDQVICATSTIEKTNINVEQLKEIFENTAIYRMHKDRGNQKFLQCSQNMCIEGKCIKDKDYKIIQISIDGENLLDKKGNPIDPNRTFSCTIDPYIGSGEQGFLTLKDLPKTKILKQGKEIPINELFRNALIEAEKNFDGNPNYPSFQYLDL